MAAMVVEGWSTQLQQRKTQFVESRCQISTLLAWICVLMVKTGDEDAGTSVSSANGSEGGDDHFDGSVGKIMMKMVQRDVVVAKNGHLKAVVDSF